MTHIDEWSATIYLFEEGKVTRARAKLDTHSNYIVGEGMARKNPHDTQVPEIGDELAAARALYDLANKLQEVAQQDISAQGS